MGVALFPICVGFTVWFLVTTVMWIVGEVRLMVARVRLRRADRRILARVLASVDTHPTPL